MNLTPQHKAALLSYARSVVVACSAVIMTAEPSWDTFYKALIAALIAPVLRWADPSDRAFGRGS